MLTPTNMAEQILRYWSLKTSWAGGLLFCEPDDATPSNLYASPIPRAGHRLAPCASLMELTGPAAGGNTTITRATFQLVINAANKTEAMLMAGDFMKHIFPTIRSPVLREEGKTSMLIGVPVGAQEAWRFTGLELIQPASQLDGPGFNQRTEDGFAGVQITFEAMAVEHTLAD